MFDPDIPESAVHEWLSQFDADDVWAIRKLLGSFRYYDSRTLDRLLVAVHDKVSVNYKTPPNRIWFVPAGYVARGGSAAHLYQTANDLSERRFVTLDDLERLALKESLVVFLDDFVGSGTYGCTMWRHIASSWILANQPAEWVWICAVGYTRGLDRIRQDTRFAVFAGEELASRSQPFSERSDVFDSEQEKARALDIVSSYGRTLEPSMPLGRGQVGGLVGFFFGSPDSTLPIFWSTSGGWKPLFPRIPTAEPETTPS